MTTRIEVRGLHTLPAALVYFMIFSAQCSRAVFVIVIAWLALTITGEASSVGRVLIWWPILSLILGPVIGVAIDRFNRRDLFVIGECTRVAGIAYVAQSSGAGSMEALYVGACIVQIGTLFSLTSSQALLQAVGGKTSSRLVIGAVSAGQAAEIVGAVAAGILVAQIGIFSGFVLCGALSIAAVGGSIVLHRDYGHGERTDEPVLGGVSGGYQVMWRDRRLLATCVALILAWAAAQMTLAFLAPFVRFELGLDARAYGWIDAMWGVGGVLGSLAMLQLVRKFPEGDVLRCSLLTLSVAICGFSMAQELWTALLLHALMGATVAAVMAVGDAQIIRDVDAGTIGRVRSNLQGLIGATGIVIYMSPSFYPDASTRTVYLGFALFLAAAAVALYVGHSQTRPKKAG